MLASAGLQWVHTDTTKLQAASRPPPPAWHRPRACSASASRCRRCRKVRMVLVETGGQRDQQQRNSSKVGQPPAGSQNGTGRLRPSLFSWRGAYGTSITSLYCHRHRPTVLRSARSPPARQPPRLECGQNRPGCTHRAGERRRHPQAMTDTVIPILDLRDHRYRSMVPSIPSRLGTPTGLVADTPRPAAARPAHLGDGPLQLPLRVLHAQGGVRQGLHLPAAFRAAELRGDRTRARACSSSQGVEKIRLTGGEPLLRKNIEKLVEMLARIETVSGKPLDLTLTTNASLLGPQGAVAARCRPVAREREPGRHRRRHVPQDERR